MQSVTTNGTSSQFRSGPYWGDGPAASLVEAVDESYLGAERLAADGGC